MQHGVSKASYYQFRYMQARKEGNAQVFGKLESTLKVAMEEKNKTLRPEIQLLNKLLGISVSKQRKQVFVNFSMDFS